MCLRRSRKSVPLPRFGLVTDAAALLDLEQREPPVGRQIPEFVRLLPIDLGDGCELSAELRMQAGVKAVLDEVENARGEDADDERQHTGVPEREPRAHAWRMKLHSCSPPNMNPTPRTVCSSFFSEGSSSLRRTRALVTTTTLSKHAAPAVACH